MSCKRNSSKSGRLFFLQLYTKLIAAIEFSVFESGFISHLKETVFQLLTRTFKNERCYYSNLNELKSEYKSKFNQLNLNYYEHGFMCLVGIQVAILLVFTAHYMVSFYKKSAIFSRFLKVLRLFIVRKLEVLKVLNVRKSARLIIKVIRDLSSKIALKFKRSFRAADEPVRD